MTQQATIAGVGFRRDAGMADLAAAVDAALTAAGLERSALTALATVEDKADAASLRALAAAWALPVIAVTTAAMQAKAEHARTASARVQSLRGVPSVCETAALAAVGPHARLLCARVTAAGAAAAIASGETT